MKDNDFKLIISCICGFVVFIGLLAVAEWATKEQKSECIIESQKIGKLTTLEIKELCK